MKAPLQLNEGSIAVECRTHSYRKVGYLQALRRLPKEEINISY
jgi:hypothetical protein